MRLSISNGLSISGLQFGTETPGGGGEGTSITSGSVTFSWTNSLTTGTDATGRAYVVVPSGTETVNQPTPAQTTDRSMVINGVMLDPQRVGTANQTQGLDERGASGLPSGSDWDALKNETGTIAMGAGNRIVKAIAADVGTYVDTREPLTEEYQVLHAVAADLGTDDVLGPTITYSGHAYPDKYSVNWTSLLALFQNRSASGASLTFPPYTEVMAQLDAQAPMYAFDTSTQTPNGYERMMPKGFHGATDDTVQYGRYIGQMISMVALGLHYDTWNSTQKTAILKKLVGLGIEWGFPMIDSTHEVGPDGGHHQFFQFPTLLALIATGRTADVPDFFVDSGGGNWDGCFKVTNALIASDLSNHTDPDKPPMWREITLSTQSTGGNVIDMPAYSGTNFADDQTEIPAGSLVMRKGAFGGVHVATVATDQKVRTSAYTVSIDAQPDDPIASGDVIWFEAPPVSVFDGAYDWSAFSAFGPSGNHFAPSRYSPGAGNEYRNLQTWAGSFLAFTAMGYFSDSFRSVLGYFLRSTAANTPATGNDYPNVIDNWNNGTNYTAVIDAINDATELDALLWATSVNEGSAPSAIAITHVAHPSATGTSSFTDGHVIGVVGDLTRQAVKISGTATGGDNNPVEVRVLKNGDSSVVQDWTHLGFIDSGTFEGTIVLPIGDDWYNFEVRSVRGGPTAAPTERIGVGYKVMVIGQSQVNIWSEANANTGLTMTAAYEDTASLYKWQAVGDGTTPVAESFTVIDDTGPDGPRAFVEQARALGITAPIGIVIEAVNGRGIPAFLDDGTTNRAFSDLTDKTAKYGKDFTAVIEWWDTANTSTLSGSEDIETLFGITDHTSGATADHGLNEELLAGFKAIIQPASRHSTTTGDADQAVEKVAYANGTPKLPLVVGWPLADYESEAGGGPHPLGTGEGNVHGGYRMALALVEAVGGTSFDKPYLTGTAERSSDGTQITIPITLPNGGTLGTVGSEVSGFYVSEDSGTNYYDRRGEKADGTTTGGPGFQATVSGSNVILTRDSGTWATNTSLRIWRSYRLEPWEDAAEDSVIADGEIYETGVTNIKGPGLPVHGQLVSGAWELGDGTTHVTRINTVTQAASSFTANGIDNGGTRYAQSISYSTGTMGKAGTLSIWLYDVRATGNPLQMRNSSGAERVLLRTGATGNLLFELKNSSNAQIAYRLTNAGALTENAWNHVLISWDLAATTIQVYINDTVVSSFASSPTPTNDNVQDCARIGVFADYGGTNIYPGDIAEPWMDTVYRDLSSSANRRNFITAGGAPEDLDGFATPHLYLHNPAASFGTNSGSGGNLTAVGTGSFADVTPPP